MKYKKQFVVIGLGRFGTSVAKTLAEQNMDVLVIDNDEEKVNQAINYATHAIQADATDEQALMSLGIRNFDVACVCLTEIQDSIMISLILKEQGIKMVMAKARSDMHAKALSKIGVDRIVFPERDTGISIAHNLVSSNILDFIELSPDYGMAELGIMEEWKGKSIIELDFRRRYGFNIVAIKHSDMNININPMPKDVISEGDSIIVIGLDEQIAKFDDLVQKRR